MPLNSTTSFCRKPTRTRAARRFLPITKSTRALFNRPRLRSPCECGHFGRQARPVPVELRAHRTHLPDDNEASTETELYRALAQARASGPIELLILGGHGAPDKLALGAHDPRFVQKQDDDAYLDLSDADTMKRNRFAESVTSRGHIVLVSCSNGAGGRSGRNLANLLGDAVPHANVWAMTSPGNSNMRFNPDGSFADPGYLGSGTYHTRPKLI